MRNKHLVTFTQNLKVIETTDFFLQFNLWGHPASKVAALGFDSRLHREDFSGLSHTSDLKLFGTPVATLPGAWHFRVSAGTG